MSIPKSKIHKMIQDNSDKIAAIKKAKGIGITPAQVECEHEIEACRKLLGIKDFPPSA